MCGRLAEAMKPLNSNPALDDIADAILDGTPIDWPSVDTDDVPDKALVGQLKTFAALRNIRCASVATPAEPWRWGHLQVFERIERRVRRRISRGIRDWIARSL